MPIPDFTPGDMLTAAQLDTISAAFPTVDGWTNYTPTLTQSGAVSKTVTTARWSKFGRDVRVEFYLDITGAGTAGNQIVMGMPPFTSNVGANVSLGQATLLDTSASDTEGLIVRTLTNSTVRFFQVVSGTVCGIGPGGFTAALAAGDVLEGSFSYEATS